MKKTVNKIKLEDEANANKKYWLNTTSEERLSMLQVLREQNITLFNKQEIYNESRKRLRRVYRVIKQAEG